MTARMAGAALVVACLASCSAVAEERAPGIDAEPLQGTALDTEHDFAVGILQDAGLGVCSGVLIAPNLVVSARHCVEGVSSPLIDCATSTFGDPMARARLKVTAAAELRTDRDFVGIAKIVTAGRAHDFVCGNDVALLILDRPIALSQYATPVLDPFEGRPGDSRVLAIGHGLDSPNDDRGESIGVRRIKTDLQVTCIGPDERIDACSVVRNRVRPAEVMVSDAAACNGDSGSAIYDQASFDAGQWRALGTLSRGSVSADGKACVESVYARFDQFRDLFLRAAIEAADRAGAPLADWADTECAKSGGCASLASPELRAEGGCAFAARVSPSGLAWPFGIFSAWLARRRAGRARRARR